MSIWPAWCHAEILAASVPKPAWLLGGLRSCGAPLGPVLPGEEDAGLVGLSSAVCRSWRRSGSGLSWSRHCSVAEHGCAGDAPSSWSSSSAYARGQPRSDLSEGLMLVLHENLHAGWMCSQDIEDPMLVLQMCTLFSLTTVPEFLCSELGPA